MIYFTSQKSIKDRNIYGTTSNTSHEKVNQDLDGKIHILQIQIRKNCLYNIINSSGVGSGDQLENESKVSFSYRRSLIKSRKEYHLHASYFTYNLHQPYQLTITWRRNVEQMQRVIVRNWKETIHLPTYSIIRQRMKTQSNVPQAIK